MGSKNTEKMDLTLGYRRIWEKLGEKYSYPQYSTWHDMHDILRDDLLNLMITKEN